MLPTKSKFDEYAKMGLLRSQIAPDKLLWIYTYSELTQFDRLWNSVTRNARGIVFDNKGRCITRCLPKFFNKDEPNAILETPRNETYRIFEKLDGSLINIVNDPEYGLVVTSKGSFTSDHVGWAKEILQENSITEGSFKLGFTYVFELINPANRIVVNYGNEKKLVLLTVIENETGNETTVDWSHKPKEYKLSELESVLKQDNFEGVVFVYENNYRVKIKTEEYIRLHRIMTGYSIKTIWESLKDNKPLDLQNMPEEFMEWFETTKSQLLGTYKQIESDAKPWIKKAQKLKTGKDIAQAIKNYEHKSIVWSALKDRDYGEYIWKTIKPKGNSNPFESR